MNMQNILYPPMGIAHITKDISDLFRHQIEGKQQIIIRSSSQPNSNPHIGSITTIMCCFALAEYLQNKFKIECLVIYDLLENSPGKKFDIDNNTYQLSLSDLTDKEGEYSYEKYKGNFSFIFEVLKKKTKIDYLLRQYHDFQLLPIVRRTGIKFVHMQHDLNPLISPSENKLHIRFKCPRCQLTDKTSRHTRILEKSGNFILFESYCPNHGSYNVQLTENNKEFIDFNTPLRDILQGVLSIEEDFHTGSLSIMLDGGDWSGVWALRVFCQGLLALGYPNIPNRIFAPIITDWSGAKFSKSLYVGSDAYKYLPPEYVDFPVFNTKYGDRGIDFLYGEVTDWVADTKKFFRNYSMEYISQRIKLSLD